MEISTTISKLKKELSKTIVGQEYMIDRLMICLLSSAHVLLEGVPGLAKTLTIKSLAQAIDARFNRIQFTPDLLPADITGTQIYNQSTHEFTVRKGPIFTNFVLADEINRSPAKVQSALLEAMQEKQITIGENTYTLEEPFMVMATQNPLEQEGTYPLPEAQVDRFMLKVVIDYPDKKEEEQIILRQIQPGQKIMINKVATIEDIILARHHVKQVQVDQKILQYIIDIVFATRYPGEYKLQKLAPLINYGGSPRASINLALAAKAHAFINDRNYVLPDDVKSICKDVLRHRIGLTYIAEAEKVSADHIIDELLKNIPTP